MFIAHLPAGYLLSRYLVNRFDPQGRFGRQPFYAGLFASLMPDLDLLYFYLIDQRQHPHHSYWSHIPIYWCGLFLLLWFSSWLVRSARGRLLCSVLYANVLLHLLLDTVVGEIRLLYPFTDRYFVLFVVPAQYDWWVFNFLLHWSFAFELLILVAAFWVGLGSGAERRVAVSPAP